MPIQFLTDADHTRLNCCPDEVNQDDLDTFFQLNSKDMNIIGNLRGDSNRLGFALQLCCLRYLGFFPNNLYNLAPAIINYVSEQLSLSVEVIKDYAIRESTRYDHQQKILSHLVYRRITPVDLLALEAWLLERALEHNRPKLIFDLACDYLHRERIVRFGTTRLARMVSQARINASRKTFEYLSAFLSEDRRKFLDNLLDTSEASISHLSWLQHTPKHNKTRAIVETLNKIEFLQENGVATWDLSIVNPNRRKWLARKAVKARVNNLRNLNEESRYPLLAAFVEAALYTFTDALLDMFDARLWEFYSDCRLEFKKDRLAATKTINETMAVLKILGELYLGADDDKTTLTDEVVRCALNNANQLTRPKNDAYVDYFAKRHRQVRNFSKRLLEVMTFYKNTNDGGLLEGLKLIADIHSGVKKSFQHQLQQPLFLPHGKMKCLVRMG